MNQVTNETTQTAPIANDISNPELSFADYQLLRRGEKLQESSNPAPDKSEQKQSLDSGTKKTEVEDEKDDSEDVDSEELEASDDSEKDKPKKKGGFQRRIDKLNARYTTAQQEIEHWKKLALKDAGDSKVDSVETKSVDAHGKPNPDSYDTHAEYVEALTDWKIEQREKVGKEASQREKQQAEQNEIKKAHFEREQSFSKKTPDYADVIKEFVEINPPVSLTFENLLYSSDNGPQILYELAQNMDEFNRINSLSPIAVAKEFGKLEAKISSKPSEPKQEIKKTTSAPKPIEPVGKSSSGSIRKSINDPELPFSDYVRLRREQMKRK